ncbi:uncharacterized protein LOC135345257 [Halichondria panicea]|uniref:uncharacterized protein LOC135345257 n=1 Tax=Halichondria panicea TaxID=6063 RepID=UPI00312BA3D3
MLKLSLGLALLCVLSSSSAEQLVPLLAWSNSDSLSGVQSASDTSSILRDVEMDQIDVAILLKSSSLSFDDIAKYGGVYGEKNAALSNLQDFLSSSASSFSVGVSGEPASELTSSLSFIMDARPQFVTDIPQLKSEAESKQLYVVELPQGTDEETFRTHDAIISKTVSTLDKQDVRYTIFYTADHTSIPAYQTLNPDLVRRAAFEDNLDTVLKPNDKSNVLCYPLVNDAASCSSLNTSSNCTTCLLFCMTPHIEYKKKISSNTTIVGVAMNTNTSNDAFTMLSGSCSTTNAEGFIDFYNETGTDFAYIAFNVTFTVGNSSDDNTFYKTLAYTFMREACKSNTTASNASTLDCGFWTMHFFAGESPQNLTLHTQYHSEKIYSRLAIPLTRSQTSITSYACGNSTLNRFVGTEGNLSDSYQHAGIQVQPFASLKVMGTPLTLRFGTAYNCQGYFGTSSLMGVVAVLILLVILYLSTVFIFSIQTIDRFDDPRGETVKFEILH